MRQIACREMPLVIVDTAREAPRDGPNGARVEPSGGVWRERRGAPRVHCPRLQVRHARQKAAPSATRPHSGNRLHKVNTKSRLRDRHARHHLRTVVRASAHARLNACTEAPASRPARTCCKVAQSYQRRGAIHVGRREQVRWQPRQRKRGMGMGFPMDSGARSAFRW